MAEHWTQLRARRPDGGSLRWSIRNGMSVRCYERGSKPVDGFCVSTRSTEVTVIVDGEMTLLAGPHEQALVVRPGQACVVRRTTPHRCMCQPGTKSVVFDLSEPDVVDLGIAFVDGPWVPLSVGRLATALWEGRPMGEADLRSAVGELRHQVQGRSSTQIEPVHTTRRMLEVKRFVEHSYADRLQLSAIARRFGTDPHYLLRAFKHNFGVPPMAYVQFLRMEHFAWDRLCRTEQTATRLAQDAGFGDYATFCRRMRSRFGVAPSRLLSAAGQTEDAPPPRITEP